MGTFKVRGPENSLLFKAAKLLGAEDANPKKAVEEPVVAKEDVVGEVPQQTLFPEDARRQERIQTFSADLREHMESFLKANKGTEAQALKDELVSKFGKTFEYSHDSERLVLENFWQGIAEMSVEAFNREYGLNPNVALQIELRLKELFGE